MQIAPKEFKHESDGRIEIYIHGKHMRFSLFYVQTQQKTDEDKQRAFQKLYGEKGYKCRCGTARRIDKAETAFDSVAASCQKTADPAERMGKGKRGKHCGDIVRQMKAQETGNDTGAEKAGDQSAVIHKARRILPEECAAPYEGKKLCRRIGHEHVRKKCACKTQGKREYKKNKCMGNA